MHMIKIDDTICFFKLILLKQLVKERYQNAEIGPVIGLRYQIQAMIFAIDVKYSNTTDGWSIVSNKQCKVHLQTYKPS